MSSEMPFVASSPPVLTTLVIGLLIAFAFQLLLTTFGIAAGVTALGFLPHSKSNQPDTDSNANGDRSENVNRITFAIGASTLLTVNVVLFVACLLAVKLSLVNYPIIGAILGVVIWSAYFLLLVWLSSQAVGSILGSILNTFAASLQGLISTVISAIGRKPNPEISNTLREQIAAQETLLTTLQHELKVALNPGDSQETVQETLQNYLKNLPVPQLDLQTIGDEFTELLHTELKPIASGVSGVPLDRSALVELFSDRTDFSKRDINQLVDRLETVWQDVLNSQSSNPQSELIEWLRSASPDDLNRRLSELLSPKHEGAIDPSGFQNPFASLDLKHLTSTVLQRVDLSDLDVSQILGQIQSLTGARSTGADPSLIQADIEDYLLHAYPWQLTRKTVTLEFKDVIYDPDADRNIVRNHLEPLTLDYFESLLQQRGDLTPAKIAQVVDRLEETRQEVLTAIGANKPQEPTQPESNSAESLDLWQQMQEFTSDRTQKLVAKTIQLQLKSWLQQCETEHCSLPQFDRAEIEQRLVDRQDLTKKRVQQVADQLEKAWNTLIEASKTGDSVARSSAKTIHAPTLKIPIQPASNPPRRRALRAKEGAKNTQTQLADYLKHLNKADLNLDNMQHELKQLLHDPQAGLESLKETLSHIDRSTLSALLAQRQDLTQAEASHIIEQVESILQKLAEQAHQSQQQIQTAIAHTFSQFRDRLTALELPDLNFDQIKHDLSALLTHSQPGIEPLSERLRGFNREALTHWFNDREDISESLAHQMLDRLDAVRTGVVQQTERLQHDTQQRIDQLKQQARHQAEETRKAISAAAWWLFITALTSAITSAIAGILAVRIL